MNRLITQTPFGFRRDLFILGDRVIDELAFEEFRDISFCLRNTRRRLEEESLRTRWTATATPLPKSGESQSWLHRREADGDSTNAAVSRAVADGP